MRELSLRRPPRTETTGTRDTVRIDEFMANVPNESPEEPEDRRPATPRQPTRDTGVSDEVWDQLLRDRAEEERREAEYHKLKRAHETAKDAERARIVRRYWRKRSGGSERQQPRLVWRPWADALWDVTGSGRRADIAAQAARIGCRTPTWTRLEKWWLYGQC